MPRFYCPGPLTPGAVIELPAGAARHAQVLRLQPGVGVTLFDGAGGEHEAAIGQMGRSSVTVQVGMHQAVEREAQRAVHLALAVPANDRMDWLVEKATELGVASIQPLQAARSVLRLSGERAARKQAHWQAIAVGACEQCGRNRVPTVFEVRDLGGWSPPEGPARLLLSLSDAARPLGALSLQGAAALVLSGPEGGLTPQEEAWATGRGFVPASLGPRTLRADTAPLAALAALTLVA